ncbi:MAG: potassium transporter Kup, partial [Gemmatimonadaceae bacterium]
FGPVTTIWFACIALLGLASIVREPGILAAVNPIHAVRFFGDHGLTGFTLLASVVLVVTGGEALYADMGHFGKRPIRLAWFAIVLPALLLNYFGQGALLLRDPSAVSNPFYRLVPSWFLYPMVVIATGAAITASQALISGAFSLTQQAVQLGYSPRVTIMHTSRTRMGQIYIPEVNTLLAIACVGLILVFQNASNLAITYGVAVTGTMTITTLLFASLAWRRLRWPLWKVAVVTLPILAVDVAFAASNWIKIPQGGWFPIVVAGIVFVVMSTWKRGRQILNEHLRDVALPLDLFAADLARRELARVPGTAIFMTSDPSGAPPVLLHHLKHNKVLHEKVVLMSVLSAEIPEVEDEAHVQVEPLRLGFYRVTAHYGFMEDPDVTEIMQWAAAKGCPTSMRDTSFYLGRERLISTGDSPMWRWRKKLFALMSRNARSATQFFGIPPTRVVELGTQIEF